MKIRYEKKNEIKTDHFWNLPNIDDTISNYFVVMQRTSNILITKQKEKLCQETYEKTIRKEEWNKNRSLLKFTKYWWHYFVVMQRTSNILITKQKEKLCQETYENTIWKKNEIKTDHLKFTKYWWDNIKLFCSPATQ